jgi:hypothetical protein
MGQKTRIRPVYSQIFFLNMTPKRRTFHGVSRHFRTYKVPTKADGRKPCLIWSQSTWCTCFSLFLSRVAAPTKGGFVRTKNIIRRLNEDHEPHANGHRLVNRRVTISNCSEPPLVGAPDARTQIVPLHKRKQKALNHVAFSVLA